MTAPNQPMNIVTRISRPRPNSHGPDIASLSHIAAPPTVVNSASEPTIGHGLPCGT
jgi:hypothetical protein